MKITNHPLKTSRLDRFGVLLVVRVVLTVALGSLVLFLPAGRWDWPWGWICFGLWAVYQLAGSLVTAWRNPELVNARGRKPAVIQPWDRVIVALYPCLQWSTLAVAGLDVGRWRWAVLPEVAPWAGLPLFVFGAGLSAWAVACNRNFEAYVRIQTDRGHRVCAEGPYRYVRHPAYVAMLAMHTAIPLMLTSGWAFLPAGLVVGLFILRTGLEDRMLSRELQGYAEYQKRVRYRLLPGVW